MVRLGFRTHVTDEVVQSNNAGNADTMRTGLAIVIPIQVMEEVFTYKPPRRKMALIIHFSLDCTCKFQMTNSGIMSVTTSSTISRTAADAYMAYWFIVCVFWPSSVQFPEMGQAWNRVAQKNVMNHRMTNTQTPRATFINFGRAKTF